MIIDCWIRTYEKQVDDIRRGLALATIGRWSMEPVDIRLIEASHFGIREGRQLAEDTSVSDPYIYTDDDVLILGKDWVTRAVALVLANPEYAITSTLSMVETENSVRPPDATVDIYPVHMVGGPMIIRKGVIPKLPEMTLRTEGGDIYRLTLEAGRKQGFINPSHRIRHNHLGHGFSSNPAHHWGY